jgi:hypothetical protein
MNVPATLSSTNFASTGSETPRTFELRLRAPPKPLRSQVTMRTRTMVGLEGSSLLTSSISLASSVSKRGQGKTMRGGAAGRGGRMGATNRLGATTRAKPQGK